MTPEEGRQAYRQALVDMTRIACDLELRAETLEQALQAYGAHWDGCTVDNGQECSCGLDRIIADRSWLT